MTKMRWRIIVINLRFVMRINKHDAVYQSRTTYLFSLPKNVQSIPSPYQS